MHKALEFIFYLKKNPQKKYVRYLLAIFPLVAPLVTGVIKRFYAFLIEVDKVIEVPRKIKIPLYFLLFLTFTLLISVYLKSVYAVTYTNGMAATTVVGQADMTYGGENSTTALANTLNSAVSVATGSGHLLVVDTGNNRVLIYNSFPSSNNTSADVVIGQSDFTHNSVNQGGSPSSSTLNRPYSVATDGTKIFIADAGNNRVLIYNSFPSSNNATADVVIGQADMTSADANQGGSVAANTLDEPDGVSYDSSTGKLLITDRFNSRVLIFNTVPSSNNASANVVVGQADFTHNQPNQTGFGPTTAANYLAYPDNAHIYQNKLFIADDQNNRVLIFNSVPSSNNASANVVIGQPDMTSRGNLSASDKDMDIPRDIGFDGTNILIADYFYNRVLVFSGIPSSNYPSATAVIGQTNFTNSSSGTSSTSISGPTGMVLIAKKLFLADPGNNRVLIYNDYSASTTASNVLGQSDFTSSNENQGTTNGKGFAYNWGLATDGTHLFVSDCGNNRVLIFNSIPTSDNATADVVIGQPDMTSNQSNQGGSPDANTLSCPEYLSTDGTKLFISDSGNNRVLVFNTIPTSNNTSANIVIGQANFSDSDSNQGGSAGANTLDYPQGVNYDSNTHKLVVTDSNNNRVLIYNSVPTSNNALADVVVGQPDMTSNAADQGGSVAARTLDFPQNARILNNKLFIADLSNNRVLVYNSIPFTNDASASVVIGQQDLTSEDANQGGSTAVNSLSSPTDVIWDGSNLLIQDDGNNRVLVYSAIPTSSNVSADYVLGQSDFTSNSSSTTSTGFNDPEGQMDFANGKLFVGDSSNNRVQIFTGIATPTPTPTPTPSHLTYSTNMAADLVVGQDYFNNNAADDVHATSQGYNFPRGIATDGTHLFVGDCVNNRVLIYNTIPATTNSAADVVIGQADMHSDQNNQGNYGFIPGANTLYCPQYVATDGTRLFIADYSNNRVLIYNTIPTTNNASADVVIGQASMTSNAANQGGSAAANTLHNPTGVSYDSGTGKLIITDRGNNRVLIYNSIPSSNNASANTVVGQTNMAGSSANQGGSAAANTLSNPMNARILQNKLMVADLNNNRLLIYNSIPSSNNASANTVVGQTNMAGSSANQGGSAGANTLYNPFDVFYDGSHLLISDNHNNRVLIYNSIPSSNNASADEVVGQTNFTNNSPGTTATSLNSQNQIDVSGGVLFVADTLNHRVLTYNTYLTSSTASLVLGQSDFTSANPNQTATPNNKGYSLLLGVATDGTHLFVSDCGNNRVLVYNTIPTTNGTPADVVIGQPDFSSYQANQGGSAGANTLSCPKYLATDGTRLFVADTDNNRVLIYNSIPTTNNASASAVVGQADFTQNSVNQGAGSNNPQANTLNDPDGVSYDSVSGKLVITDSFNNRVLLYDSIPTTNNASASAVVGQADFTHSLDNQGGSAAGNTLSAPWNSRILQNKLVISDAENNRVLIYNTIPTTNNASASAVFGQPDMVSNDEDQGGSTGPNTLDCPFDVLWDGNYFLVADSENNRILVFNSIPTTNNASADMVIGQQDMGNDLANQGGGPEDNTFFDSGGQMDFSNNILFAGDKGNNRVLMFGSVLAAEITPTDTPTPTSATSSTATPTVTGAVTNTPTPASGSSSTTTDSSTTTISSSSSQIGVSPLPPTGPKNITSLGVFGLVLIIVGAGLLIAL